MRRRARSMARMRRRKSALGAAIARDQDLVTERGQDRVIAVGPALVHERKAAGDLGRGIDDQDPEIGRRGPAPGGEAAQGRVTRNVALGRALVTISTRKARKVGDLARRRT